MKSGVTVAGGWVVGEMDGNLRCVYVLLIDTDLPLYFFKDGTRPSTGFLLEFLFFQRQFMAFFGSNLTCNNNSGFK